MDFSADQGVFEHVKKLFVKHDPLGLVAQKRSERVYDMQILEVIRKLDTFKNPEEITESLQLTFYEAHNAIDLECSLLAKEIYDWWNSTRVMRSAFDVQDSEIEIGAVYQHYKGDSYKVHGIVKHSESLEDFVLYEALYENKLSKMWVRPRSLFLSTVKKEGKLVPRFKKLD